MDWQARKQAGKRLTLWSPNGNSPHEVTDGMIHDWSASLFVPKAKIEKSAGGISELCGV